MMRRNRAIEEIQAIYKKIYTKWIEACNNNKLSDEQLVELTSQREELKHELTTLKQISDQKVKEIQSLNS